MPANLENSVVATGPEKSVFIPIPKKGNAKECSNYCTIALISYTSKVMLKILQARLQQYMNWFQKNIYFWFIDYAKVWLCGSLQTGKFFKRWEYQTTWLVSWEICMQVKKQQLVLDMEQQTGSK